MNQYIDPIFLRSFLFNLLITPWFIVSVFLAFYVPGRVILGKSAKNFSKDVFTQVIICLGIGLVAWAYQGVIFGYVQLRSLSYIYVIVFFFIWVRNFRKEWGRKLFTKSRTIVQKNVLILAIFILGIFGQNQQFVITAFEFSDGIRGFTGSIDDTMWHTGLIESLTRTFPPIEPGMHGVVVHNYHYWSNMVIAELIRVFHLPLFSTQYLFFGIFISFLLGSLAYVFGKQLGYGRFGLAVIVYLQYFASDVIYIVTFITRHSFLFTIHPLEDGTMLLENTPRAFSFIVVLLALVLLKKWLQKFDNKIGILLIFIIGSIIGFKVHTGAMALFSIVLLACYLVYIKRFSSLYILLSIIASLAIYLPVNSQAGAAIFLPFEMTSRNFVVQKCLGLERLELARRVYLDHANYLQAFRMDITMLLFYAVSQFGIRILGFIPLRKSIQVLSFPLWLVLYGGALFAFAFGALFIQPVASADIFNSFLAGSFFLAILASVSINNWIGKKRLWVQLLFILILISLTVPRWFYKSSTVRAYSQSTNPIIASKEIEGLHYLGNQSDKEVVLVLNKGQWDSHYSYVSILAKTNTFLSGQVIMGRHGINFENREKIIDELSLSNNNRLVNKILSENRISYLYFYGKYNLKLKPEEIGARKVFANDKVEIYKVQL